MSGSIVSHPSSLGVTTNRTIRRDLLRSLEARGVSVGRTWGAFKAAVEALGVRDNDPLVSIEYGNALVCTGRIVRDDDEDGIEIREVR